jgi:hypothetical protein
MNCIGRTVKFRQSLALDQDLRRGRGVGIGEPIQSLVVLGSSCGGQCRWCVRNGGPNLGQERLKFRSGSGRRV